ncbi:putative cytochrome P450 [Helianthus debilis subsp. tardiflorus]
MAFITPFKENTMSFSLFLLLLTPLFLLLLLFLIRKYFKSEKNLPPGPRPWPIIGNLHQVGKNPHVTTAILAQEHGPLISLHLGTQILIVASSPEAAMGILKTQDRFLSSRFVPHAFHSSYLPHALIWSLDCDENWKSLRRLCRTEMFSVNALEFQSSLREEKLAQMIDFLCSKNGQVVNIEEVVFTTMFNTLSNIIFGKDFLDLKDQRGTAGGLKEKLVKILEYGLAPNISDFFPLLQRLDLQGLRKQALKHMEEVYDSWVGIINERRSAAATAYKEQCFLDRLIQDGFSNEQINILALVSLSLSFYSS